MLESLRNLSPQTRARMGWALAPVLASLAVLLQWIIDVPKAEMITREDEAADKDDKDDDDSSESDADPTPERPKSRARKAPKPKPKPKPKPEPRTEEQLAKLRETWSSRPLEEEPVDPLFRRANEALLRSVATHARTEALGRREPVPMQIRPTCRTLRCALELCGDRALIDEVAELLPRANVSGTSLWHELREVDPTRQPAKHEPAQTYRCRRWIVDFALENVEVGRVTLDAPER